MGALGWAKMSVDEKLGDSNFRIKFNITNYLQLNISLILILLMN